MQQQILTHLQATQKLQRIAYEIAENTTLTNEITLIGLNEKGLHIAQLLQQHLTPLGKTITLVTAQIINNSFVINDGVTLTNKTVLLVDDVLNTGYTMAVAFAAIIPQSPASVHLAVLVNRDHRNYCIMPNYTGISLATTLQEHITVAITNNQITATLS